MLGAALGSFALVVAERWDTKRSWVKGRSQCDSCKKVLQPVDLVPIFSWLSSRGKCRQCDKKISMRYPLSEISSAVLLLFTYVWFPYDISLWSTGLGLFVVWLVVYTLCMILILIDLKQMIMPYKFLFPLIAVSALFRVVVLMSENLYAPSIFSLVFALVLGSGAFALLWIVSKGKWIGDSDIFLGLAIALIVGGAIEVWIAFVAASISGLLFGIVVSMLKKKSLRHMKIPFGPFLVLGMVVSFLFSQEIIDFYITVFLSY